MAIPEKIKHIVTRINQELEQTEQIATEGLNLTRFNLSLFPDNVVLLQFFAAFSNILVFVEIYRRRVQTTLEQLEAENVPTEVVQEAGEDLGTILGQVLEAKINTNRLKNRLES